MAKVLCINDFPMYSEMVALLLHKKGRHHAISEIVPFDVMRIHEFDPDVIVLNLVRKPEALGMPLTDFEGQVDGARAFRALAEDASLRRYPLVLTAIAVLESELPQWTPYMAFVEIPYKIDNLLHVVERAAAVPRADIVPE